MKKLIKIALCGILGFNLLMGLSGMAGIIHAFKSENISILEAFNLTQEQEENLDERIKQIAMENGLKASKKIMDLFDTSFITEQPRFQEIEYESYSVDLDKVLQEQVDLARTGVDEALYNINNLTGN